MPRLSVIAAAGLAAALTLLAGVLHPVAARADEPAKTCPCPPPPPPAPLWTGSLGLSYVATSGNSDNQTLGLAAAFARQPTPWGVEIVTLANRAETDGVKTGEKWLAGVRGKRALTERFDLFAGVSYERDRFAGFDSRVVTEAGAQWHALTGPVHELAFDAGLTYTSVDPLLGSRDGSVGGLAGLTYVWKITATTTLRERLLLYPNFEHTDDWRMRSETAVEASLAASWALRVGYLYERNNRPPAGFRKVDGTTSVSVVWKR